jgi:hypothetical protein
VAYIVNGEARDNKISGNALLYVVNLIDTRFTRYIFTPFIWATSSIERELFRKNEFSIQLKVGQETNYYIFYHSWDYTTESHAGLSFKIQNIYLSAQYHKPWTSTYLVDNKPYLAFDLSVRFD